MGWTEWESSGKVSVFEAVSDETDAWFHCCSWYSRCDSQSSWVAPGGWIPWIFSQVVEEPWHSIWKVRKEAHSQLHPSVVWAQGVQSQHGASEVWKCWVDQMVRKESTQAGSDTTLGIYTGPSDTWHPPLAVLGGVGVTTSPSVTRMLRPLMQLVYSFPTTLNTFQGA